jgi:uncharacterized protein (DUF488 family)
MGAGGAIWTVGHSNHSFERLLGLLRSQQIDFAIDVRSYPYSRFAPQFNRESLEVALREAGVGYLFLGEELGGRPDREDHYDEDGRARYDRMAAQPAFRQAVQRVAEGCRSRRLALLCSEADPHECHRRRLVGKVLAEQDVQLRHIFADGTILIEDSVDLRAEDGQESLFGEETAWRSTQSVSHRRRLSASSAA